MRSKFNILILKLWVDVTPIDQCDRLLKKKKMYVQLNVIKEIHTVELVSNYSTGILNIEIYMGPFLVGEFRFKGLTVIPT